VEPTLDMKQKILLLYGCALLASCTTPSKTADSREPSREMWTASDAARKGDPAALHQAFLAAVHQVSMPYANAGEDAEGISEQFSAILSQLGDASFASALSKESPRTRGAVREFFSPSIKSQFPKTFQVLAAAPAIDWPSDKAYRHSWISSGQPPPEKPVWN